MSQKYIGWCVLPCVAVLLLGATAAQATPKVDDEPPSVFIDVDEVGNLHLKTTGKDGVDKLFQANTATSVASMVNDTGLTGAVGGPVLSFNLDAIGLGTIKSLAVGDVVFYEKSAKNDNIVSDVFRFLPKGYTNASGTFTAANNMLLFYSDLPEADETTPPPADVGLPTAYIETDSSPRNGPNENADEDKGKENKAQWNPNDKDDPSPQPGWFDVGGTIHYEMISEGTVPGGGPGPNPGGVPEPTSLVIWSLLGLGFARGGWARRKRSEA